MLVGLDSMASRSLCGQRHMFMDIFPLKEPVIFSAAGGRILVREIDGHDMHGSDGSHGPISSIHAHKYIR